MIAKLVKTIFISTLIIYTNFLIAAGTKYKMTIEDLEVSSGPSVTASIYIENVDSNLIITSYQCALSLNQEIDLSSLSLVYIEGSSELLNEPNLYIGIDNIDGPTELTFVSFIGNDLITKKTRVGTFSISGYFDLNSLANLDIKWDFEGTICTIITGENFENITNPLSHQSLFGYSEQPDNLQKLEILDVVASSTSSTNTSPLGVIDGKGYDDGDPDARWATQGMPATLTFDLGEEKVLCKTRFSFFYFDQGRIYQYNVNVSNDGVNWINVLSDVSSKEEEWSEEWFDKIRARYVELEIVSSINNPGEWANLWEAEIWGESVASSVDDQEVVEIVENIPSEYGISQNYPNPFNPSTKVEVMMKDRGSARLDVYNVLGEKVLSVLDDYLSAGVHTINIDGSRLSSGMYIYQLIIDNKFTISKKMNLMK